MSSASTITAQQSDLRVGRRIHCILYGGKNGTIIAVHGTPDLGNIHRIHGGIGNIVTGHEAHIDIVWDRGSITRGTPESIVTGVQWRFLDQPDWSPEEIQSAVDFAAQEEARHAAEAKAQAEAFRSEVEHFRVDEAHALYEQTPADGSHCDKTKLAAKNIRKLLKKSFPGVKFSVRKEDFDSIWVSWKKEDDGETVNQISVDQALKPFQTGYYSLHEDLHRKKDSPFNVVFGGVRYMTCQPSY